MNYLESIRLKHGLFQFLMDFDADLFVTLTLNLGYSLAAAKRKLEAFHARLDRLQLGKSWCKSEDRTRFIAVPETKNGTIHYHLLLKLPTHARVGFDFEKSAPALWKKITPAGTFDVKPIKIQADHVGFANYMTKQPWHHKSQENYILWSEFVKTEVKERNSVSR